MGRAVGWEGGSQGSKAILEQVKIVTNPQTFEVITAYPVRRSGSGTLIALGAVRKASYSSPAILTMTGHALLVMNAHGTAMAPMM
jgi:hypothetical protein